MLKANTYRIKKQEKKPQPFDQDQRVESEKGKNQREPVWFRRTGPVHLWL